MKIIDGYETPAASNVINKAAWERNAPTKLDYANQAELVLDKLTGHTSSAFRPTSQRLRSSSPSPTSSLARSAAPVASIPLLSSLQLLGLRTFDFIIAIIPTIPSFPENVSVPSACFSS